MFRMKQWFRTREWWCTCSFLSVFLWVTPAFGAPIPSNMGDICSDIRQNREKQIHVKPDIELTAPLRVSGKANCFSPAENLFFIALIAAQKELGPNSPWYKKLSVKNGAKSEQACEILGYGGSQFGKSMQQCVAERFSELMRPYHEAYKKESATYINKRNKRGETLMKQCLTSFYQKLPKLPRSLYFPLAYYDRKVHSYPDWYIKGKMHDFDWLQNMGSVKASNIIMDAVGKACPGDMIWWLYMKL